MKNIKSKIYRKYFYYFFSFGLVIALLSSVISYFQFHSYNQHNVNNKIDFQLDRARTAVNFFINGLKKNVEILATSDALSEYVELPTSNNLLKLEKFMLSLIQTNSSIYQLRFLDASGNERVKINADTNINENVHYSVKPYQDLQNKSGRYYFQATKPLPQGQYYVSNLDLNKEYGVYEIPYRPTLRVSSAIKGEKGEFLGLVAANLDATFMLNVLTSYEGLDAYLIDGEGHIVFSNHQEYSWSRYLNKFAISREVLNLSVNEIKSMKHLDVSALLGNNEELRLLVFPSEKLTQTANQQALTSSLLFIFIVSLVAFPIGLAVAYGPAKNSEQLAELTTEHELYTSIVDKHVPIVDTDLTGTITRINDAMCNLSGYRRGEVVGRPSSIFQHDSTEPSDFVEMWQKISDGQTWQGEFHNQHRNGESFWLNTYISPRYDNEGQKVGYISVSSDITDKRKLQTISDKDVLTGLYNRSKLNHVLDSEYKRSQRYAAPFSVLILDIDHFKTINDSHGHLVGDKTLVEVSNLLRYNVRQTDFIGRWGGEEFIVVCPNTELKEGVLVAEKLRKSIEHFQFEEVEKVTVSIGVTAFDGGHDIQKMLEVADQNLYKAKATGRNRVVSNLERYAVLDFPMKKETSDTKS